MKFNAEINVMPLKALLDPQGKAVLHAMNDLKFKGVNDVRIGKYIELTFDDVEKSLVEKETKEICQKILANPVMENFDYEIVFFEA